MVCLSPSLSLDSRAETWPWEFWLESTVRARWRLKPHEASEGYGVKMGFFFKKKKGKVSVASKNLTPVLSAENSPSDYWLRLKFVRSRVVNGDFNFHPNFLLARFCCRCTCHLKPRCSPGARVSQIQNSSRICHNEDLIGHLFLYW